MAIKKSIYTLLSLIVFSIPTFATTKIMTLGDSTTHGRDPVNTQGSETWISYRGSLWSKLKNSEYDFDFIGSMHSGSGYHQDFDTDHEGHAGYRTITIKNNIDNYLNQNIPDIVLFHLGTNDLTYSGYGDNNPNNNKTISVNNMKAIIDRIFIKNSNAHIFIARIITNGDVDTSITTAYNDELENMLSNHNSSSSITVVNMETGVGLNKNYD